MIIFKINIILRLYLIYLKPFATFYLPLRHVQMQRTLFDKEASFRHVMNSKWVDELLGFRNRQ